MTTPEDEVSDILKHLGRDGGSKTKGKSTKKPLAKSSSLTDLWMRSAEKTAVSSPSKSDSGREKNRSVALALALSQSPTAARRSTQQAATLEFSGRADEGGKGGGIKSLATRSRRGPAASRGALFELMGKVQSALASETAREHKDGAERDKIENAKESDAAVNVVPIQRNKSAPTLLQKRSNKEVVAGEENGSDGERTMNNVGKKVAGRRYVEIEYALDEVEAAAEAEAEAAGVTDVLVSDLFDILDEPDPRQNIIPTHKSKSITSQSPLPLQLPSSPTFSKRKRANPLPFAAKSSTPKKRRPLVLLEQNVPLPVPPTLTPKKQSTLSSDDFPLSSDDIFANDVEAQEIEAMLALYDAQSDVVFRASRSENNSAVFFEGDETGPPSSPTRVPKEFLDGWGIEDIEAAMAMALEDEEDEDGGTGGVVKNGAVGQQREVETQVRIVMVCFRFLLSY